MKALAKERYVVDEDDPRAPPADVWEQMTDEERQRVLDSLPSEFEASEAMPPEGDQHFEAKVRARETLKGFFTRASRSVYVGCELPIYYPAEKMFAPDIMAVLNVPLHKRDSWVVSKEGRGLDFALEVIWSGRRRKDLEKNVERYARLGIREYFVFDRKRMRLHGYRLADTKKTPTYQPILAQKGLYASQVLDLDLFLEQETLRFFYRSLPLPDQEELVTRLEGALDTVEARVRAAEERAEEQSRRAEEATQRAEEEARARQEEARARQDATQRAQEAERARQDATQRAEEEARARQDATQRAEEETRARQVATQRAEDATQRAEEAERELAEARALIERLKRGL